MAQATTGSADSGTPDRQQIVLDLAGCCPGERTLEDSTCLLGFCARWPGEAGGEALRAELRGLGAELAVLLELSGRSTGDGGPALTLILLDSSAIGNATGKRIRSLPITPDKLL